MNETKIEMTERDIHYRKRYESLVAKLENLAANYQKQAEKRALCSLLSKDNEVDKRCAESSAIVHRNIACELRRLIYA